MTKPLFIFYEFLSIEGDSLYFKKIDPLRLASPDCNPVIMFLYEINANCFTATDLIHSDVQAWSLLRDDSTSSCHRVWFAFYNMKLFFVTLISGGGTPYPSPATLEAMAITNDHDLFQYYDEIYKVVSDFMCQLTER